MKNKLRVIVGTFMAIMIAGCGTAVSTPVNTDRLQQQYQYCLEKGGSFSSERGGFSCSLPEK